MVVINISIVGALCAHTRRPGPRRRRRRIAPTMAVIMVCRCCCQSACSPVYFPPPYGIIRHEFSEWLTLAQGANYSVALLPLAKVSPRE